MPSPAVSSAFAQTIGNTQLTYMPQVNPSPLTASYAGLQAIDASLLIVVTNNTGAAVTVQNLTFSFAVGTAAVSDPPLTIQPLMASAAGVQLAISSPNSDWTLVNTSGNVTGQMVVFTAAPPATDQTLADGDAVTVQWYNIPLTDMPGSTTVVVGETLLATAGSGTLAIPILPPVFYLNSFFVTDEAGNPATQVALGQTVTLVWNCSQSNLDAYTILQSSAEGQQYASVTTPGTWTSQPLLQDTSFILQVQTSIGAGTAYASLPARVRVVQPALFASTLKVMNATNVSGYLFVEQGLTINNLGSNNNSTMQLTTGSGTLQQLRCPGALASGACTAAGQHVHVHGDLSASGIVQLPRVVTQRSLAWLDNTSRALNANTLYATATDGMLTVSKLYNPLEATLFVSYIWVVGPDFALSVYPNSFCWADFHTVLDTSVTTVPVRANSQFVVTVFAGGSEVTPSAGTVTFAPFGSGQASPVGTALAETEWLRKAGLQPDGERLLLGSRKSLE